VEIIETQPTMLELIVQNLAVKAASAGLAIHSDKDWLSIGNSFEQQPEALKPIRDLLQLFNSQRKPNSAFAFCLQCSLSH